MSVNVIKFNGEKEPFSEQKIIDSARRVGVPEELHGELLRHITSKLYENIPTAEIFTEIKKFLKEKGHHAYSTRYNLKNSLAQLGPSGYPFEKYLARLLEEYGYLTKTNQVLAGACVRHEIDVVAKRNDTTHLIEAKFHSKHGVRTDVKTALYIKARYEDILSNWKEGTPLLPWMITNTRFTTDCQKYADCISMKLTSWDYPRGKSLREMIEAKNLHPVTILDSLSKKERNTLLDSGIVTCKQVESDKKKLESLLPKHSMQKIRNEAKAVCSIK